jgi:hypothetical protein
MDDEQFVTPTPTARFVGKALIFTGVLLLILIEPISDWYVHLFAGMHDLAESKRLLVGSTFFPALLFATLTSWLGGLGHKTISMRHWPPPGLPILFRTRIQKGKPAIINGVGCFLAGGVTGVLALFWFYLCWKSYNL